MQQTSAKCAAAQQGLTGRGKGFPLGVPFGMACGQALQPCGLTGGLTTSSRLRRTHTPNWMKEIKKTKRQQTKRFTVRAHSPAHSPCQASTYRSGKVVQTNRATSPAGSGSQHMRWPYPCRCVALSLSASRLHSVSLSRRGRQVDNTPSTVRLKRTARCMSASTESLMKSGFQVR